MYYDYVFVDITLNQYADADTQKLRVSKGAANAIQTEGIQMYIDRSDKLIMIDCCYR